MEKIGRVVVAVVVAAMVGLLAGWYAGKSAGRTEMIVEAVKNNHGHYKITDELGRTVFEWGAHGTPVAPQK